MSKNDFLGKCINELSCSRQLFELNGELAEIFEVLFSELIAYCKANNIPLTDLRGTRNLLNRAEALFNQIAELKTNPKTLQMNWLSDVWKHSEESDGKGTEPCFIRLLYWVMGSWLLQEIH